MLTFPSEQPDNSPMFLWSLQQQLLQEAEARLGVKDPAKTVCQPTFSISGPHIINTQSSDGAFATLSPNAAGYWPTAVYELAHETVHLLNPTVGATTVLEEGIAETFALEMARTLGGTIMTSSIQSYADACNAVKQIASDIYAVGKGLRESCGALSRVTETDLLLSCPGADPVLAGRLVDQFKRE